MRGHQPVTGIIPTFTSRMSQDFPPPQQQLTYNHISDILQKTVQQLLMKSQMDFVLPTAYTWSGSLLFLHLIDLQVFSSHEVLRSHRLQDIPSEGDGALERAAQGGCGVSFSRDIQDPPGQGPVQPAVGDPASAGGLD